MTPFSVILVGSDTLTRQCGEILIARGHPVAAVLSRSQALLDWAAGAGLRAERLDAGAAARLGGLTADWLLSVANLVVLPPDLLARARRGAVNFHDGPLPRHAGLNAPVWALLQGEARHGITWHRIGEGIDDGPILVQRSFDIAPDDTALTLNTRCFEAALESFPELLDLLAAGPAEGTPQDLSRRTWHGRHDRPAGAARIDFRAPQAAILRLVRALDHGGYRNPLACPKLDLGGGRVLIVRSAEAAPGGGAPGQVLAADAAGATVACADGAVRLSGLAEPDGASVDPRAVLAPGRVLPAPDPAEAARIDAAIAAAAPGEARIARALAALVPAEAGLAGPAGGAPDWRARAVDLGDGALPAFRAWAAVIAGEGAEVALSDAAAPFVPGYLSGWAPLPLSAPEGASLSKAAAAFAAAVAAARRHPTFAADLPARDPAITRPALPQIGLRFGDAAPVPGTALTLALPEGGGAVLRWDAARLSPEAAELLARRLEHVARALAAADPAAPASSLPPMPPEERALVLEAWNATRAEVPELTLHAQIEAQVARTPEATALIAGGRTLGYRALDAAANRAAHVLIGMGVRPGMPVALACGRSEWLVIGALAILKAGGAYVPLDPAYPAERLALYLEDSGARVVVTESAAHPHLPGSGLDRLVLDADPRLDTAPVGNPAGGAGPGDPAYIIYTSGSTGRPKGVVVTHRNVANFLAGMDERIPRDPPGTWLAVTSLSFDISVLELFWTLARGFRVVLMGDAERALTSGGTGGGGAGGGVPARRIDFSLFYWGNDDGPGPRKYELLLEGARFADAHGFAAVWTPERHFHAFGGPYPNPAVTGAAVAAVTRNLAVRAGSCVAPLHHPARIAEDWAVIDNLTGGRAGIAFASGWQPEDFVLRPENAPPANRRAMLEAIDQVRRLWRGEAVEFPAAGGPQAVRTLPRPVSPELAVWITTAGNPETWIEAGRLGANILTHLLGQSVAEVGQKIALYHEALRASGHDPDAHVVTLMLHTFLARDREQARAVAEGPMKAYLRSAAGLIKQYAWAFPAFKKPQGVTDPAQIDLSSLSDEEMEGILDFAFLRYFEDSGLFGTVEDALARVEELRRIGVGEIACLIDYGIAPETVLEGLHPLAEVVRRANAAAAAAAAGPDEAAGDRSIAAEIRRHGVTHLQCTPSMARLILADPEARAALAQVRHLFLGGEALPGALVAELAQATAATIENMYGPTETTIWSATGPARTDLPVAPIGRPIANTRLYVLDGAMRPCPVGVAGELWIGGAGVARGYWRQDALTADRFRPDPFAGPDEPGARLYGTGDLVRWRADGTLDFLGRIDAQVKVRGFRIEPGEIEAAAEAFPGVRQAVVVVREDSPGDARLVAYVAAAPGFDTGALRAHLAARLPPHMVPAHLVRLDSLPLTPNRKIDRRALPPPQAVADGDGAEPAAYVAPGGGVAEVIAGVWRKVLGVPRVGARDNFFALGGHSLLAVQAHRELRAALGTARLSITDIYRFPTLEALAAHLGEGAGGGPAPPAPAGGADARAEAMARRRALRAARGAGG
jgi:natural product biosynthesis luciferase-like monooxygenase protein